VCLLRMQRTKTELYPLISDLKTKKDFEKEIKTRYKQYGELVDQDTIALVLVDELGRNTQSITKIVDLLPDKEFTVIGKVRSIADSKTFKRKNGSPGKVLNLEIADDSGSCRLVLWNGDTDQVKNKEIHPGKNIKIINGYTKQGYTGGMEINLGRWGLLEVTTDDTPLLKDSHHDATEKLTGVLIHKDASRAFFKDNGEFGFVTTITIQENKKETHITLWDRSVRDVQSCNIGDIVTLTQITTKNNNGKLEYHMNGESCIQKHT
jgi:replication factor A1